MLYDENYIYDKIDKSEFEELMDLYEGEKEVKGTIYSFYEDEKKKVHKLIDLDVPDDKWNLISKYYVVSMNLDQEINNIEKKLIHIINLGYFIVSGPYYKNSNDMTIFESYDKKYKNLNFEFTDEEFIKKYNYFNAIKIYKNGDFYKYDINLFNEYLSKKLEENIDSSYEYIMIYAYKGKKLEYYMNNDFDKTIKYKCANNLPYEEDVKNVLNARYSKVGVLYKREKNKYVDIFKIGF